MNLEVLIYISDLFPLTALAPKSANGFEKKQQ